MFRSTVASQGRGEVLQRGRRQGWLSTDGLEEVCRFIAPAKGDNMHFSGSFRCEQMRKCYEDRDIK